MATSAASTSAAGSLLRPFALSHAAPARTGSDSDAVLKRLIAHNAYFDAILSLIPESVWRHRDDSDSDDDGMNVKYKKGSKRVDEKFARKTGKLGSAAADESDEEGAGRSKAAARRVRFNAVPVAAAPALTGGKRPRPADSHDADGSDEDADLAPAGGAGAAAAGGVSFAGTEYIGGSIEVLRARLRAKIEAARATRGARDEASAGGSSVAGAAMDDDADEDEGEGEPSGAAKAKAAKGAKAGKPGKPGKPADKGAKPGKDGKPSKHGKPAAPAAKRPRTEDGKDAGAGAAKPKQQQHSKPQGKPAAAAAAPAPSGGDFSFGGLTLDAGAGASAGAAADGGASASRTVGPDGKPLPQKGNKVKRMTSLLRAAEKSRARIERAAASGDAAAKTEAGFSAAMRRAAGEKVLDNPTLIAASLKRLKKGKAKSAAAWADRKSKVRSPPEAAVEAETCAEHRCFPMVLSVLSRRACDVRLLVAVRLLRHFHAIHSLVFP